MVEKMIFEDHLCPKCKRKLKPSTKGKLVCRYCNIIMGIEDKKPINLFCTGCKYKKNEYPHFNPCTKCLRNKEIILRDYYQEIPIFKINKFLTLKLEEKQTRIYVNNELFQQCKYLLLNISSDKIHKYDQIKSIDEISQSYDRSHEHNNRIIPPETEFLGHCSNLQAWYEHDYDTRILHRNIAFPLLKKLTDAGDPIAKKVFKEEIALRISEGYLPVVDYLIEQNYFDYFTEEELETVLENINNRILQFFIKLKRKPNYSSCLLSLKKFEFTKTSTSYRVKELTIKKEAKYRKQERYNVEDILTSSERFFININEQAFFDFNIQKKHDQRIILNFNSLKSAHEVLDNDPNNYLVISRNKVIPEDFIVLNFEKKIALYFHGMIIPEKSFIKILKKEKRLLHQAQERWKKYGFKNPNLNKSNPKMMIPQKNEGMKVV